MTWYYAIDQQRQGPVSREELMRLVREGKIGPDTLVWCQGMENWQRWADVQAAEGGGAGKTPAAGAVPGGASAGSADVSGYAQAAAATAAAGTAAEAGAALLQGEGSEQTDTAPEYAGFWIRVGAKLIDGCLLWMVGAIKDMLLLFWFFGSFNVFAFKFDSLHSSALLKFQLVSLATGLLIGVLYTWYFLARYEATPGKLVLNLKVVRADGGRLGTGQIFGRYFAEMLSSLILCIGYLMVIWDHEERRALHDRLCETRVVKTPEK